MVIATISPSSADTEHTRSTLYHSCLMDGQGGSKGAGGHGRTTSVEVSRISRDRPLSMASGALDTTPLPPCLRCWLRCCCVRCSVVDALNAVCTPGPSTAPLPGGPAAAAAPTAATADSADQEAAAGVLASSSTGFGPARRVPVPQPPLQVPAAAAAARSAEQQVPLAQLTKLSQLRKRAVADGIDPDVVDEALDSEEPRAAIVALIEQNQASTDSGQAEAEAEAALAAAAAAVAAASEAAEAALRAELSGLKLTELRKRALADGADSSEVDEALDSDDPKAGLAALVLEQAASSANLAALTAPAPAASTLPLQPPVAAASISPARSVGTSSATSSSAGSHASPEAVAQQQQQQQQVVDSAVTAHLSWEDVHPTCWTGEHVCRWWLAVMPQVRPPSAGVRASQHRATAS